MRARVDQIERQVLNPRAECTECEWMVGAFRAGREAGRHHAAETGHVTKVIVSEVTVYRRRDPNGAQLGIERRVPNPVAGSGEGGYSADAAPPSDRRVRADDTGRNPERGDRRGRQDDTGLDDVGGS